MDSATEVVRKRIDELGTREPTIIRQGAQRIVVQVPGLDDPGALKALLGQTAKLEFKLVDTAAAPSDVAQGIAPERVAPPGWSHSPSATANVDPLLPEGAAARQLPKLRVGDLEADG